MSIKGFNRPPQPRIPQEKDLRPRAPEVQIHCFDSKTGTSIHRVSCHLSGDVVKISPAVPDGEQDEETRALIESLEHGVESDGQHFTVHDGRSFLAALLIIFTDPRIQAREVISLEAMDESTPPAFDDTESEK